MHSNKALSSIAISSMLVLMAMVVVVPIGAQAAWPDQANLSISPAELYPGETTTSKYTLDINSIDNGVTKLTISNVWVKYSWETAAHDILASSEPRTIGAFPAQVVFSNSTHVPTDQAKGAYSVNVTVWAYSNDDPLTLVTHTFTSDVSISDPVSAVASADPTTGYSPQNVTFDVTASGGNGVYSYTWNFGDGTANVSQKSPTHTYDSSGKFTATVTVTDSLGRSTDTNTTVTIAPGIGVTITAQPLSGPFPLEVKFSNTVTNSVDNELTYLWNFGDGSNSTESSPTYTYNKAGNYNVNLKVTDSRNRSAVSTDLTVRVSASIYPIASINASVSSGHGPLTVDFTSTVEGGTYPYNYMWSFGDGSTDSSANPSHTYDEPGVYVVQLTTIDSASRQDVSEQLTITVLSDTTMKVVIGASSLKGTSPLTVNFNSTIVDGTGPFFYTWNFGDGNTSTSANATHLFNEAGEYSVTLSVKDSLSNVTISNTLAIVVSEPKAATIPAWVLIWGSTGAIIAVVGVVAFTMMRRRM
ncbi:MAG: PKD domain-containing protein [Methanomassiliicoccus sp.]|nr:PKD domain-containing protein [Methanomassiliicoccus sp.]